MPPVDVVGQIYIRIVEARTLRGVESNGLSDPFVQLYLEGQKKDPLKTKVVPNSVDPQWHQEFLLTCSSPESTVTFDLYDYNSIMKNVFLGTATLRLQDVSSSPTLHDLWLPLTTQGDLHILVHFTPLSPHPRKAHIRHTFHQLRVVLNSGVFYPGAEVYGCVVAGICKPKKVRGVHLHALGCSSTHWTTGSKHKTHYYADAIFYSTMITLYGLPKASKSKEISLFPVGPHICPFKLVLPTTLPPSFSSFRGSNRYTFNASIDIPGALDKVFSASFVVLSLHTSLRADEFLSVSTLARGTVTKDEPVTASIQGPTTAFVGENYTFKATIQNNGKKDIVSLQASLKYREYFCAYRSGITMVRCPGYNVKLAAADIKNIPGFPLKPGSSWSGEVTIPIPKEIKTSLYSSISPLIQNEYTIKLKIVTSGNVFTKCTGENKYFIVMASKNVGFEHVPLPTPSNLKPGVLYTTPFIDQFYASVIPRYAPPNPALPEPNAGLVIEMLPCSVNTALFTTLIEPEQYPGPRMRAPIPASDWTPGTKPSFVISESLSPDDLETISQQATSSGIQ